MQIKFYSRATETTPHIYDGSCEVANEDIKTLANAAKAMGCSTDCLAVSAHYVFQPDLSLAD